MAKTKISKNSFKNSTTFKRKYKNQLNIYQGIIDELNSKKSVLNNSDQDQINIGKFSISQI